MAVIVIGTKWKSPNDPSGQNILNLIFNMLNLYRKKFLWALHDHNMNYYHV